MATDPELTDAETYREKLRSLGFSARPQRSRTTPVVDDRTGRRVGTQTEHRDGRVDATAERVTVVANPNSTIAVRSDHA